MANQRLELTWIGKGDDPKVEPRILLHDASKDYGDPNTENMLIHGDNLLALKALEQEYAGRVKWARRKKLCKSRQATVKGMGAARGFDRTGYSPA